MDVADGVFTVALEVDAAVFDDSPRYLKVQVRAAQTEGSFAVLSPRQSIAPVPYAVHSASASPLDGVAPGSPVRATGNGSVGIGNGGPKALFHLYWEPDSLTHLIETGGDINGTPLLLWSDRSFIPPQPNRRFGNPTTAILPCCERSLRLAGKTVGRTTNLKTAVTTTESAEHTE